MKKLLFIIFAISAPVLIMAQDTNRVKEVGVVFSDLNDFGITFKFGSNRGVWRINTLLISGDKYKSNISNGTDEYTINEESQGYRLSLGREYRLKIVDKFQFRVGFDASYAYDHRKEDEKYDYLSYQDNSYESIHHSVGINLVLGFNYAYNNKLVIGAEILPGYSYNWWKVMDYNNYVYNGMREYVKKENENKTSNYSFNLSNMPVLLSIAYRF